MFDIGEHENLFLKQFFLGLALSNTEPKTGVFQKEIPATGGSMLICGVPRACPWLLHVPGRCLPKMPCKGEEIIPNGTYKKLGLPACWVCGHHLPSVCTCHA